MRPLIVALTILAAACAAEDPPTGPGGGGGGGGGTGGSPDGGSFGDGGSGTGISGRLCIVDDVRIPELCPTVSGIGGVPIEVNGVTTTSADNGSFSVASPGGSIAKLRIAFGDDGYRDVVVPIGLSNGTASGLKLPLIRETTWQSLLTRASAIEPDNSASIASYFVRGDFAVTGVEVQAPAGSTTFPIYDRPNDPPDDWAAGALTGPRGAAIMVGVPASNPDVSFLVIPPDGAPLTTAGVPVEADALTFVTVSLP